MDTLRKWFSFSKGERAAIISILAVIVALILVCLFRPARKSLSDASLHNLDSLLEVVVAYLSEELHLKRQWATVIACVGTMFLGAFASLSLMENSTFAEGGYTLFGMMDFLSSNILLPLGGVLIVVFVGWYLGKEKFFNEVTNDGVIKASLKRIIFFIIRYLAPVAIAIVFISGLVK